MDLRPISTTSATPSAAILPSLPPSKPAPSAQAAETNTRPYTVSRPLTVPTPPPALERVAKAPPKAINGVNTATNTSPRTFRPSWPDDEVSDPIPGAGNVVTKPAEPAPILEPMKKKVVETAPKKLYIMDSQCVFTISMKEFRQGDLTSPFPDAHKIIGVYTYAGLMVLKGNNLNEKIVNELVLHGDGHLSDHIIKSISEKTMVVRTVYPAEGDRTKVMTIHVADTKGRFGSYRIITVERIEQNTLHSRV